MEATDESNKLQPLQSSRALTQPTNLAWSFLPPLSLRSDLKPNPNPNPKPNVPIDVIDSHFQLPLLDKIYTRDRCFPPRKSHRRSNSDIPLGFSAMIESSPQLLPISGHPFLDSIGVKKEVKSEAEEKSVDFGNTINLENVDVLHSSGVEDKDSDCSDDEVGSKINRKVRNEIANGMKHDSLDKISELGTKRSYLGGEFVPTTRHFRSISIDSFMDDLAFDDKPRKLESLQNRIRQQSPTNSMNANSMTFSLEFGNGEFTEAELKKIMANDKLAEIALSDPKRTKRILANRQSAARSKERKTRYISELELKVQSLQTESTTLSTKLALIQRETSSLSSQNNELKFRLQAMEQHAQLKDALSEALTSEIQRIKEARSESRCSTACLGSI